jgi:hypothetical protein
MRTIPKMKSSGATQTRIYPVGIAGDWNRLGGSNVEARSPVWFVGGAVEIFLDELFHARQSIAPAHREIMAGGTSDG